MNAKRLTAIMLITLVFVLTIYDFVIYYFGGSEATISLVVLRSSLNYPIIPFGMGVLCGHLLAPLAKYPVVVPPDEHWITKPLIKPTEFHDLDDIA